MNLFDSNILWQAHSLPEGISFENGVFSGKPNVAGEFDVPVSVSNSLGSDNKNIHFLVIDRDKFPVVKNNELIDSFSIPQLQSMIQNGDAQEIFDCENTYMLIYLTHPRNSAIIANLRLNFCAFRDFTLLNGSTKNCLILQFHQPLWNGLAPFDLNDFNRWKYSHLRRWLNSDSDNWFYNAYQNDNPDILLNSYLDNVHGFLSYLPQAIVEALVPVRIHSLAFFDDFNTDAAIDDPDYSSGKDFDATFDKVFIPSLSELNLIGDAFEGSAWEFYSENGILSSQFRELDGNMCNILTRSAFIETYDNVCAVDANLNIAHILTSSTVASPAPAFVLC